MAQMDRFPNVEAGGHRWLQHDDVDPWNDEQSQDVTGNVAKDTPNV